MTQPTGFSMNTQARHPRAKPPSARLESHEINKVVGEKLASCSANSPQAGFAWLGAEPTSGIPGSSLSIRLQLPTRLELVACAAEI
jgi:hypothetical protein